MNPPGRLLVALLAVVLATICVGGAVVLHGGASDGMGATDAPQVASASRDANDGGARSHRSSSVRASRRGGSPRESRSGANTARRADRGSANTAGRSGASGSRRANAGRRRGNRGSTGTFESGEGGAVVGGDDNDGGRGDASGARGGGESAPGGGGANGADRDRGNPPSASDNGPGAGVDGGRGTSESSASNEVTVGPPFENGPLAQVPFGVVAVGSSSRVRITVRNVAEDGAPRSVTGVNIRGANPSDFAVTESNCAGELPQGGVCTVQVTFTPAVTGERRATMDINVGPCCGKAVGLVGGVPVE